MSRFIRTFRTRRLAQALLVTVLAGGVVAGGAIAWASIPASSGVINGCYNALGVLRVIDSAATCAPGETALNWNQAGPRGEGFTLRGAYASGIGATYSKGDVVEMRCNVGASSLYLYTNSVATQAGSPCTDTSWTLFLASTPGAQGPQGPQGPQGAAGPQGPAGASNAHWAIYNGNTLTSSSDGSDTYFYYWQTGRAFLWFNRVADISKCAVTVSAGDPSSSYNQPVFATVTRWSGYAYLETSKVVNGTTQYVDTETDVTVTC